MSDIAPYLFERAETAPTVPPEGRFLLPVCITEEELSILLGAAIFYAEKSAEKEIRHLIPLMQAMEYIGQPEYADCVGFFENQTEDDCLNYLPYAPFADYYPQNPYNEPDFVPPDYLMPPFLRNTDFEYPELFGYKASDIFVPFGAVTIAPENVFTLNYPQIKISVRGSGQIELELLSVTGGGFAVLKVGSPPNILDILQELIIETGVVIIDLENDSASIPPESDIVIAEEINIEAAVNETTDVYVVFIPKLNDSLNALGFGGGIRSIGLCGFEQDAMMAGIEDVRYNELTGGLDKRVDGVWAEFATCEQLVACAPVGGGGGGGGGLLVNAYELRPTTFNTNSLTFVDATGWTINHAFTKQNALIQVSVYARSTASFTSTFRLLLDASLGDEAIEAELVGDAVRLTNLVDAFSSIEAGTKSVKIQAKSSNVNGVASISSQHSMVVTIIEFDDASSIFVEDVRIVGRELQKKIGGVWITVSDSLNALFASIDSQISSIIATNTAQQTQINSVISVNSTQNTRLTALENRATDLEVFQEDAELSLSQNALTIADHESRIAALEAAAGVTVPFPIQYYDKLFLVSQGDWSTPSDSWVSGQGFVSNNSIMVLENPKFILDDRVDRIRIYWRQTAGAALTMNVTFVSDSYSETTKVSASGLGTLNARWLKMPKTQSPNQTWAISFILDDAGGAFRVERISILGRDLLFTDGD